MLAASSQDTGYTKMVDETERIPPTLFALTMHDQKPERKHKIPTATTLSLRGDRVRESRPMPQGKERIGWMWLRRERGERGMMERNGLADTHMSAHVLLRVGWGSLGGGSHVEADLVEADPLSPSSETKTGTPAPDRNPPRAKVARFSAVTCSSGAARQGRPCLTGCRAYWVRPVGPGPISRPLADLHMIFQVCHKQFLGTAASLYPSRDPPPTLPIHSLGATRAELRLRRLDQSLCHQELDWSGG